jgi:DNA-binding NarL/FixJ family response regulator
MTPRLLLADDHHRTAELLAELLAPEFDVVAQVHDGLALLAAVEALAPDVIVSDISMPGLDGIAATASIIQKHPAARIVLITFSDNPLLEERGYKAGALGHVMKSDAAEQLIPAVRSALRGERHVVCR